MFTGIVEDVGRLRSVKQGRKVVELEIETGLAGQLGEGDSIAVNGVCLTATTARRRRFSAEVMPETLDRSTLGELRRGSPVNLELAARLSDRMGGHIVQGHVDAVAEVVTREDEGDTRRLDLRLDEGLSRYLVPKGSITLDGVSLTVVDIAGDTFQVALIPHTLENTTLGKLRVGDKTNVEVDVLAKYVDRLMNGARAARPDEGESR